MKKSLSNKAFNKVFSSLIDSLTPERVSAIIDARPEDGLDVLILGRLNSVSITDWPKFNILVQKELKKRLWDNSVNSVLDKVTEVNVSGVMSFEVKVLYHRDTKTGEQNQISLGFSATDDIFDNCVKFEFKD